MARCSLLRNTEIFGLAEGDYAERVGGLRQNHRLEERSES
jgi:hypothetical protein